MKTKPTLTFLCLALGAFIPSHAFADDTQKPPVDDAAELAKKLSNPVAELISVPFQENIDFGYANDGWKSTLNIQPVVPFALNDKWNLIVRTIMPVIHQENVVNNGSQGGLGDITQSFFFSPKAPGPGGMISGFGPVLYYPTATDDLIGAKKFGIGPTALVLWQKKEWTYGILANHIWSVAGDEDRQDISATFLQPFLAYQTKTHTTFTVNMESTYDWKNEQWTVPLNGMVSQLVKIGKMPVSFAFGLRYYAEAPDGGPEWGLRFVVTLLFPK